MATKIDELFYELELRTTGFENSVDSAKARVKSFSEFVETKGPLAAAAFATALVALAAKATLVAAEYEKAMVRMRQAQPQLAGSLSGVTEQIDRLGSVSAQSSEALTNAAVRAAQTGAKSAEEVGERLRIAAEVADASGSDIVRIIEGLDDFSDAFGLTTQQAADAMRSLFAASQGRADLAEVLDVLAKGQTTLATFNVSATDAASGIAALLDAGVQRREAGSVLVSLLDNASAILKKTSVATDAEKAAVEKVRGVFNPATIASRGFLAAITDLTTAVGGNALVLEQAGFSSKEASAAMAVGKAVTEGTIAPTVDLATATAKMAAAAAAARDSNAGMSQQIRNDLNATLRDLGDVFLPKVNVGLRMLVDLFDHASAAARANEGKIGKLANAGMIDPNTARRATQEARTLLDNTTALTAEFARLGPEMFKGIDANRLAGMIRTLDALGNVAGTKLPADWRKLRDGAYEALTAVNVGSAAAAREGAARSDQLNKTIAANVKAVMGAIRTATEGDAKQAAAALEQFREKIATLGAGDNSVAKLAVSLASVRKEAGELFAAGKISANEYKAALKAVGDTIAREVTQRQDDLRDKLAELSVAMTASLVDDMALALRKQTEAMRKEIDKTFGAGTQDALAANARVDAWAREVDAQIAVVRQQERIAEGLREVEQAAQDAGKTNLDMLAAVDTMYADTEALLATLVPGTKAYADALKLLLEIEQRRAALAQGIGNPFEIPVDDSKERLKAKLEGYERLANQIAGIAHGAIAAAEAMGYMDAKTANAAKTMVQAAESAATLVTSLGSGNIAGALASGFSLLTSIGALIAGGSSAEAQERARVMRENTEALRVLAKTNGDLAKIGKSGNAVLSVEGAVKKFADSLGGGKKADGTEALIRAARAAAPEGFFAALGVSMDEIKEIAARLNITLDGSVDSWLKLAKALGNLDTKGYGDGFAAQLQKLGDTWAALNVTDPVTKLKEQMDLLAASSPAFAKAIEGLDLKTVEGRAEALVRLQALFKAFGEGALDKADFGDLSPDELREQLLEMIGAIFGLGEGVKSAAEKTAERLREASEKLAAVFDEMAQYFDAFDVEGAAEKLAEAQKRLKDGALGAILDGLDLSNADGLGEANKRVRDAYNAAIEARARGETEINGMAIADYIAALLRLDGMIDDAAKTMADAAEGALEDAKQKAEDAKAAAEDARQKTNDARIKRARDEAALTDADSIDALKLLADAYADLSPAFSGVADAIRSGDMEKANELLRQLFEQTMDPALAEGLDLGSLTLEEFRQALLDLEADADGAVVAVRALGDEINEALTDLDVSLEINNVTDAAERLTKTSDVLKSKLPAIAKALEGLDLSTTQGRADAETRLMALFNAGGLSEEEKNAVRNILRQIRDMKPNDTPPGSGDALPGGSGGAARDTTVERALQSATASVFAYNPQFALLLDIERNSLTVLTSILAVLSGGATSIAPPNMPASGFTAGVVVQVPVNFYAPVSVGDPMELARALQPLVAAAAESALGTNLAGRRLLSGRGEVG